jgi:hypothetical protein
MQGRRDGLNLGVTNMTATASSTRSLFRKSLGALVLTGALASTMIAGATSAQAFPHPHHGWGPGLGIGLGLGLLGAAVAADYSAPRVCHLERQFDEYGNYIGRIRVCRVVVD